jgi:DNA repair protein RadC
LSAKEIWQELRDYRNSKKEHFFIFYLDSRNQEIKREIVSIGSLNMNSVHPREVFEPAIKNSAAQVILSHNHPSNKTEPSESDLLLTKRLVEAGKLLGIEIIDHIIIAENGYFSFKAKKLL